MHRRVGSSGNSGNHLWCYTNKHRTSAKVEQLPTFKPDESGRLAVEAVTSASTVYIHHKTAVTELSRDPSNAEDSQVSQPDDPGAVDAMRARRAARTYARHIGSKSLLEYFQWHFLAAVGAGTALSSYSGSLRDLVREVCALGYIKLVRSHPGSLTACTTVQGRRREPN